MTDIEGFLNGHDAKILPSLRPAGQVGLYAKEGHHLPPFGKGRQAEALYE